MQSLSMGVNGMIVPLGILKVLPKCLVALGEFLTAFLATMLGNILLESLILVL